MNEEVSLMPREACPLKAQTLLTNGAPTLLRYKLELGKNIAIYNPKRVLQQFGYYLGTVRIIGDMFYSSELVAENMFVGTGRLQLLAGVDRLF